LGTHTPGATRRSAYNEAIRKLAEEYDAPIVDFLNAQNEIHAIAASYADQPFTINGVHWNALGYRASAHVLGKSLGWELDSQSNIANAKRSNFEKLREAIIEKNRLYFHRWRPQNVTYLFGFRKHEQGQNAKEINQFDPLIEKQEAEIHRLKQPRSHRYHLRKVDR